MSKAVMGVAVGVGIMVAAGVTAFLDPALAPLMVDVIELGASMVVSSGVEAIAEALSGSTGHFSMRQAAAPGQGIYGMARVSGTIVWASTTGSKKDYLNLIIVWACHPCQSIESIYIDGRQVFLDGESATHGALTGDNAVLNLSGLPTAGNALNSTFYDINGNQYNFNDTVCVYNHLGGATSTNPFTSFLTPNDPSYPTNAWFNGLTCSYLKLIWNSSVWNGNGIPEIKATLRGKNTVYDPRTGIIGFSDNPALCVADLLCDPSFGAGCLFDQEIDEDQLIAAANACDAQVNLAAGGTESTYTCNGSFPTNSSPGEIVSSMLDSCAGRLTYTSGLFGIFPGVWLGSSGAEITINNTIGNPSVKLVRKYRDLCNIAMGTFICPSYPYAVGYNYDYQDDELSVFDGCWQPTSIPYWTNDALHGYSGPDYITLDGGRTLTADIKLQFVISVSMAQRIEKIAVMRNRYQATATFPCDLSMWNTTALDNITVLFPYLGLDQTMEVQSFKFTVEADAGQPENSPRLTTELMLAATDVSVYEWTSGEELGILITASPTINDFAQIAPPTGLSLTSGSGTAFMNEVGVVTGRILATWIAPADTFITDGGYVEVQWQIAGASTWNTSGLLQGSLTSYLCSPCLGGSSYNVRVRGLRSNGVSTEWVQVSAYTCSLVATTINAADVFYAGGATVASLEPAMAGADVTTTMSPVMILNPGFEAGAGGWFCSSADVNVEKLPTFAYAGSWCGVSSAAAANAYIVNQQQISVKPGQVIQAQCLVNASSCAAGSAQIFVNCNSATAFLANVSGNQVNHGVAGWNLSSVVCVCPPGTTNVFIGCFFNGPNTSGSFFVDNFQANYQSTSLTEVPDDANYSKLATSQTTLNLINGVYGSGSSVGVAALMSATNQDIALNLFFNAAFVGTTGVAVTGSGDGQPSLPSGSLLDIWHTGPFATSAVFEGGGLVEMSAVGSGAVNLGQYIPFTWVGNNGGPFCLGVQVAWLSATQPNGDFTVFLAAANDINNFATSGAGIVSATFPASALSSTSFGTCILQGILPTSATYVNGYVAFIQHGATNAGYMIVQPMLTYGAIMPIWTAQYPTGPVTTPAGLIFVRAHVPKPTGINPIPGQPYYSF
jgi:hypothetical protein